MAVFLPEVYISVDQNHRHSHAQRQAICATALRWMLAGSLIWEVRHNEPFYRQEVLRRTVLK